MDSDRAIARRTRRRGAAAAQRFGQNCLHREGVPRDIDQRIAVRVIDPENRKVAIVTKAQSLTSCRVVCEIARSGLIDLR